ncbi:ORF6N domain-containing protein [Anaerococcus tetradius]|uniref:Toxin-antitoxin system, toxin component, Bro family n=1 Tax=Anaerococcus tetradius ATCC 35098 TaxID=525255 RepID=C2CFX6_9FIRM|nr:ORF6N domain-containing protein [Anaerococcus tetradius]EEI83504.1 toxin-antitoxin system, toxin component, Bro family [Anaerococcus tetradius ATCC 35098]
MNSITINNNSIERKLYNNQPVVTFKDIDLVHERVSGTARRNFYKNQKHFIENEDYYLVTVENAKCTNFVHSNLPPKGQYLFTESGYLMLVKSFTDDLAWEVQRQLVNSYFRLKEETYEQLEIEPHKLEKKTYKGKPVMTVRDIVYLTGQTRDSLNWAIKRDGLGLLLQGRSLEDFREENSFVLGATRRLNILFNEDVYRLTKNQNIPGEKRIRINEYFNNSSIPREEKSIKVKDVEILQKVENLNALYFLIQRFGIDEKMKGDITEIISEKYVELGFLDHKCRDLRVHTLEGWNLGCKFQNYKMMIINN